MTITISTRAVALAVSDAIMKVVGHLEGISYPLYLYGNPDAER